MPVDDRGAVGVRNGLWFANIPIAVPKNDVRDNYVVGQRIVASEEVVDSIAHERDWELPDGELALEKSLTVPSVAETLQAHTKRVAGRRSRLQPRMWRRVPAGAFACACAVLKV